MTNSNSEHYSIPNYPKQNYYTSYQQQYQQRRNAYTQRLQIYCQQYIQLLTLEYNNYILCGKERKARKVLKEIQKVKKTCSGY